MIIYFLNKYFKNDLLFSDNASCHTVKKICQWLEKNEIEVLDWPAYSPDISPKMSDLILKSISTKTP